MPKPTDTKVTEYPTRLRDDLEISNYLRSHDDGSLEFFAISLLYRHNGRMCAVVRYDNEGGKVHRDRLLPNGDYLAHRESVKVGLDLHDAVRAARQDLATNCERYLGDFLARI